VVSLGGLGSAISASEGASVKDNRELAYVTVYVERIRQSGCEISGRTIWVLGTTIGLRR
jgi:hypothetical protein